MEYIGGALAGLLIIVVICLAWNAGERNRK